MTVVALLGAGGKMGFRLSVMGESRDYMMSIPVLNGTPWTSCRARA